MNYEQLQKYQQSLLERALTEGIKRNDEQTQTWSEYKSRHEKVVESLNTFSRELTLECMVPIGKKALMRGKLTHTNEILVSLGEGYFAKYSASQAVAVCDRRIKRADEILESLKKERNLYEMRRRIPECFDAFGNEERRDTIEHWDVEKLKDWRAEHRLREKEYRKKLAESRATEKRDIKTEEDLFARLDALELQEELEEELHRLEAERPDFYSQDPDGEDDDDDEDDVTSESSNESVDKSDDDKDSENRSISKNPMSSTRDDSAVPKIVQTGGNPRETSFASSSFSDVELNSGEMARETSTSEEARVDETSERTESKNRGKKQRGREKRVIFGEPRVKYFDKEDRIASTAGEDSEKKETSDEDDSSEDDVVRIEFKHSENEPAARRDEEPKFASPADVYRLLPTPKPILKNFDASTIRRVDNGALPTDDKNVTDADDGDSAAISAYDTIVRDVRERVIDAGSSRNDEPVADNRPISKFRRERMKR